MKKPKPENRNPKAKESAMFTCLVSKRQQSASDITRLLFCLLTVVLCSPVFAQYVIDWHTIDGGGGTSTGGVYSVSGTIGQSDAGLLMSGGNYSLQGGFWAIVAVQVPGAPVLTIVPTGMGQARISWEPATTGWVLQETLSLSPTNWVNSPSGSTNSIVVPAAGTMKFYRLHKP